MTQDSGFPRPVRVTIVHDDDAMRELLDDVLTSLGFRVQQFAQATADLHTLIASDPQLILVELRLDPHREELSGLQTIHAARSTQQLRDVPIIVCSADPPALADAWPDFMDRGDIQRLELPFDLDTLAQVIGTALGEQGVRDPDFGGTTVTGDDRLESNQGS